MSENKITQEQLEELQGYVGKLNNVAARIGNLELQKHQLNHAGIENTWKDVRTLIKTDSIFRDANVNWEETEQQINSQIDTSKLTIVQGFLGGDSKGNTTTLGREGSSDCL